MFVPSDYRDVLKILNKHKVRYLIVGAYAVIYYAEPRYTKDIDIWVEPTVKNSKRVYESLKEFGAPLKGIKIEDFTNQNLVYQMGVSPVRVDIIMGIPDINFTFAWKNKTSAVFEDIKVNIISLDDLLKSKRKTKRPIDAIDIENLKLKLKLKSKKKKR